MNGWRRARADEGERFWKLADKLARSHPMVIDRPRGSRHPRMPEIVYPLDYGSLDGTGSVDGGGVDVWRGSLPELRVTAVIATVDVYKGDAEAKLLIGCTPTEARLALAQHNQLQQAGILLERA